jgi:predicted ATPase/class 3 adenylate cyclase/DNA-binding CsgD family transcriptional regulator
MHAGPEATFAVPAGTVTFLLTDIEGSTQLWERAAGAMPAAVARHYAILDEAIEAHGGVRPVEQGEGDSVVGAFSRAGDALAAAVAAQRMLVAESWPEGVELRVRMALHTGDAQLRDEGNYFGAAVIRCARLRSAAHGGQVLLSQATYDLVRDRLPENVELVDLGAHRLRDLGRAEHLWALAHPELPVIDAPPRSLDALANNLPVELSSFVGRERELGEVREKLTSTRLLTLTGAGGCGKTRLALQAAADAFERFPGGVWWVELAPIVDPGLLGEAVAAAVGVRALPGRTATDAVVLHLHSRRALVVLDNCEHLLAACAELAGDLLQGCPQASVMTTSREPLGLPGETSWRVPSLSLPVEHAPEPIETLRHSDAVKLFIDRALQVRPNFSVTNDNAPAVAQICHDLDGIPLAIELAAARVRLMSVQEIADGLADRFHLLTGGARTALPRQQTLRASVDWSHQLLDDLERTLLRRLGVFAGGFTLDAAERVCEGDDLGSYQILDLLSSLVDRSLVQVDEREGLTRYRLLETVRHFALDQLNASGELERVRDRHVDVYVELAERCAPMLDRGVHAALDLLDSDAANLHAAIAWATRTEPDKALRLCTALTFWWRRTGPLAAGLTAFESALAAGSAEPTPLRGRALAAQALLLIPAGDVERGLRVASDALAIGEELDDDWIQGRALYAVAWVQCFVDPRRGVATCERGREHALAAGDEYMVAANTRVLAFCWYFQDNYDVARHEFDRTEEVARRLDNPELLAVLCLDRSLLLTSSTTAGSRRELLERTAQLSSDPLWASYAVAFLGWLDVQVGQPQQALERLAQCRERIVATGAGGALASAELHTGAAHAALGNLEHAQAMFAAVAQRGADGFAYIHIWALSNLATVDRLLGDETAARAHAERAIELAAHVGSAWLGALATHELGRLAAGRHDFSEAEGLLHDALAALVDGGHRLHIPDSLEALAEIAAGLESYEEAVRLLTAAERARTELGIVRWWPEDEHFQTLKHELQAKLGDEAYEAAHTEGQALSLDDAIAYVRRARGSRKRPSGGWESLTPTELEVAHHAAAGLTNPEIGQRMFISRGTVKIHLSHIYAKVGVRNRSELAAYASRRANRQDQEHTAQ